LKLLRLTLAKEGLLCNDDLNSVNFGDEVFEGETLCIFIVDSKREKSNQRLGQWAVVPSTVEPWTAFQLLLEVLIQLLSVWSEMSIQQRASFLGVVADEGLVDSLPLSEIPITRRLVSVQGTQWFLPDPKGRSYSYEQQNNHVKELAQMAGFEPRTRVGVEGHRSSLDGQTRSA